MLHCFSGFHRLDPATRSWHPSNNKHMQLWLGFSTLIFAPHATFFNTRWNYRDLIDGYGNGFLNGKHKEAREIASKPSSEIDALILERILLSLDEDNALETFFDAIPGFCNSKLTILPLPFRVEEKLRQALDGFLNRTFTSNLVSESVRASRLITCLNAAHAALGPDAVSQILDNVFKGRWDEALQSIEVGHALRRWGHSRDHDLNVRRIIACIITRVRGRDDRWTALVKEAFGVPDGVLRDNLAHGDDSVLLSILIHVSRQASRAGSRTWEILPSLSKFDVRNTHSGLQDDFCTMWTEIAQEAKNQGSHSTSAQILREFSHLYVALHQDTDSDADNLDFISLYDIASDRLDSTTRVPVAVSSAISGATSRPIQPGDSADAAPHQSTLDCDTALRLAEETNVRGFPPPPYPSTTGEIGEASQTSTATSPFHSSGSPSSDGSSQDGVAAVQPDNTSAAELSYPLSTVPTPAPVLVPTPPANVLSKSSATYCSAGGRAE
ncbi:hypothetical protein DFH94DRAFT_801476 [Russula ochroleuca]|uniref:Uncharacterized protein n=1 Tax=Russula ochroleuca TaxID=152965 RepID=A0A9P5JTZ6_9AGAM|nr:hypothetical protein DFH94DRAFT_801476 [Russula ochroleuca]